jgi:hypothetical protein
MVAPVHNFDPKIAPEVSAKLRWARRGGRGPHISQPLRNGRVGRTAPVWRGNEFQKTGARSARARTRGQNPLVTYILLNVNCYCDILSDFLVQLGIPFDAQWGDIDIMDRFVSTLFNSQKTCDFKPASL